MKHYIYFLAAALMLTSCNKFKEGFEKGYNESMAEAKAQDSLENLPEVKLHTFDGGNILVKQKVLFSEGDRYEGETIELASPFYVIQHPEGNLLWDTGLPEGLVGQGDVTPDGDAFTISRDKKIVNQLAGACITVDVFALRTSIIFSITSI